MGTLLGYRHKAASLTFEESVVALEVRKVRAQKTLPSPLERLCPLLSDRKQVESSAGAGSPNL